MVSDLASMTKASGAKLEAMGRIVVVSPMTPQPHFWTVKLRE